MARNNPNAELTIDFARASDQSLARFRHYLRELIADRRREPREDVVSVLVQADFDGDRLGEEELLANLVLFLIAGHETTTNLIANGIFLLASHPEQLRVLQDRRELLLDAIEEILRYEAPVQRLRRVASEDFEMGGAALRKGEAAELVVGSANRDETKWEQPDVFDIMRKPFPHLAFGKGTHFCIGAGLAYLEGTIALGEVLNRFGALELPAGWQPAWATTTNLRTLKSLPVKVVPRA
jgi:cytochrome P450